MIFGRHHCEWRETKRRNDWLLQNSVKYDRFELDSLFI